MIFSFFKKNSNNQNTERKASSFSENIQAPENKLKEYYLQNRKYIKGSVINFKLDFAGGEVANYQTPLLYKSSNIEHENFYSSSPKKSRELLREKSFFSKSDDCQSNNLLSLCYDRSSYSPVDPSNIFQKNNEKAKSVVIITKFDSDINDLNHHLKFSWSSSNEFWPNIEHVYRLYLSKLLEEDLFRMLNSGTNNFNLILKELVLKNLNESFRKTLNIKEADYKKIIFLIDDFDDIAHLFNRQEYANLKSFIDYIISHFNSVVSIGKSCAKRFSELFRVDEIYFNEGYGVSEINSFLFNNFKENPHFNEIVEFIRQNKIIQEAAKSPSFLRELTYILVNRNQLLNEDVSTTQIYYHLYLLLNNSFNEKYNDNDLQKTKDNFIDFLKHLAFIETTSKNNFKLDEILKKHHLNENQVKFLLTSIPILKIDNSYFQQQHFKFTDTSFKEFFAAFYIIDLIKSNNIRNINKAIFSISTNIDKINFIKFIAGIVAIDQSITNKEQYLKLIFKALENPAIGYLKIDFDNLLFLQMRIINKFCNLNEIPDIIKEKTNFINKIILADIAKWHNLIINSGYINQIIKQEYLKLLSDKSADNQVLGAEFYAKHVIKELSLRTDVISRLIHLVKNSNNLLIREAAIKALESYDLNGEVIQLFDEILANNSEFPSITISVLEILSQDANPNNIKRMAIATSHKSPLVIYKAIELINKTIPKNINNAAGKSKINFKDDFLEIIFSVFLNNEITLSKKTIFLLKEIFLINKYSIEYLLNRIILQSLEEKKDEANLDEKFLILKKLFSYGLLDSQKITDAIQILIKEKDLNRKMAFYKFILDVYYVLEEQSVKNEITNKIIEEISSNRNENYRIELLNKLDTVIDEFPTKIYKILLRKLQNSKMKNFKLTIIKFINNKIIIQKNDPLQKLLSSNTEDKLKSFVEYLKTNILTSRNSDLVKISLELLYNFYSTSSDQTSLKNFVNDVFKLKNKLIQESKNFLNCASLVIPEIDESSYFTNLFEYFLKGNDIEKKLEAFHSIDIILNKADISNEFKYNILNTLFDELKTYSGELIISCLELFKTSFKLIPFNHIKLKIFNLIHEKIEEISKLSYSESNFEVLISLENLLPYFIDKDILTHNSSIIVETQIELIKNNEYDLTEISSNIITDLYFNSNGLPSLDRNLETHFITPLQKITRIDPLRKKIITFFGILLSKYNPIFNIEFRNKNSIIQLLIDSLSTNLPDEHLITQITNFLKLMDDNHLEILITKLVDISNKLIDADIKSVDYSVISLAAEIDTRLNNEAKSSVEFEAAKVNFIKIINKISEESNSFGNSRTINDLATRILANSESLNPEEISNLNYFTIYLGYLIVNTNNKYTVSILLKLFNYIQPENLNKLNFVIYNQLKSLDPVHANEVAKILVNRLEKNQSSSNVNPIIIESIIENINSFIYSNEINIELKFPTIDSILESLNSFVSFVQENKLPITFKDNQIIVGSQIYKYDENSLDQESAARIRKSIYLALTENLHAQLLLNSIKSKSIFTDYTRKYLELGVNNQLSILQRKNDNGYFKQTYLIFEQADIFGNSQITYYKYTDTGFTIDYTSNNINNYREIIFGAENEFDLYDISTYIIKDGEEIIKLIKNIRSESEVKNILDILNEKYRATNINLTLAHNELIKFSSIKERLNKIEREQTELMLQWHNKLSEFQLQKKSIDSLILAIQNNKNIQEFNFEDLNEYQTALVKTIIFQLETLFSAARVVQTELVANNKKGIIGNIGNLVTTIAPNIPVFSPAIWFLGEVLNSFDEQKQQILSKNIAELSVRENDAKLIIEEIAFTIARNEFKLPENNDPNSITEYLNNFIETTNEVLSEGVINTVLKAASNQISNLIINRNEEHLSSLANKGEEDGMIIVNILASLFSSGNCLYSTSRKKQTDLILEFLKKSISLQIPIKTEILANIDTSNNLIPDNFALNIELPDNIPSRNSPQNYLSDLNSPGLSILTPVSITEQNRLESITYVPDTETLLNSENIQFTSTEDYSQSTRVQISDYAIFSGGLMKTMEAWGSLKYLFTNYIPLIPNLNNYSAYLKDISQYEHEITSTIYAIGAGTFSYTLGMNPYYAIASSLIYYARPYIYEYENKFFEYLKDENYLIAKTKIPIYFITELAINSALAIPLINVNGFMVANNIMKLNIVSPIIMHSLTNSLVYSFNEESKALCSNDYSYYFAQSTTTLYVSASIFNEINKFNIINQNLPYIMQNSYLIVETSNVIMSAHSLHQLSMIFFDYSTSLLGEKHEEIYDLN